MQSSADVIGLDADEWKTTAPNGASLGSGTPPVDAGTPALGLATSASLGRHISAPENTGDGSSATRESTTIVGPPSFCGALAMGGASYAWQG